MRTFVTSYSGFSCFDSFFRLVSKFYPVDLVFDLSPLRESKSSQLIRLFQSVKDDYVILLEEDFFFVRPVDLVLLAKVEAFCQDHNVDRFSLQGKNAYAFSDWPKTVLAVDGLPVYQADQRVGISFALEASIWKRSFLLNNLKEGLTDAQIEVWISNTIRHNQQTIYALDRPVMEYRDAVRGGKTIITLHDDPLRLVAEPGHSRALYPIGEGSETLLL